MATRAWKKEMDAAAEYTNEWVSNGCPGPVGVQYITRGSLCIILTKHVDGGWRYGVHPANVHTEWTDTQKEYYDRTIPYYMTISDDA
jgi:hypothetical protein